MRKRSRGNRSAVFYLLVLICMMAGFGDSHAETAVTYRINPNLDQTLPDYAPDAQLKGLLTIAGSDTMQPILAKLAKKFQRWHPQLRIAIQGSQNHGEKTVVPPIQSLLDGFANARRGDGKIMGHLGSNEVRLLALGRDLTQEETALFVQRYAYKPTAVAIAQDAVAVYVNSQNPIPGLTMTQVDAIFSKTRKRQSPNDINLWSQLGLNGMWQVAPIRLYGRNKNSMSTRIFFQMHVLLNGEFKDNLKEEQGSASVVLAVANDPLGIGYSSIGFQNAAVRIVPLAEREGDEYVYPTQESVTNGTYPLSRRLNLYVNRDPEEALQPAILEFLKFANSRTGQAVVSDAGVFPLQTYEATANLHILAKWHR